MNTSNIHTKSYMENHEKMALLFSFLALIWFIPSTPAFAHKVTIFAWIEGDTVHTQSKFSGGRPSKDSTVVVYDMEGTQLLEGKTNEKGEFSFKIPKKTELKVALKASMGHLAEWVIPVEEITDVSEKSETEPQPVNADSSDPAKETVKDKESDSCDITKMKGFFPPMATVNRKELRKIIDESLDQKLAPLTHMLADSMEHKPGITEIVGGIGYIFGLVGVALYFSNRRKKV